jgi:glycosyltransferase involved in cell wall biosynthesis
MTLTFGPEKRPGETAIDEIPYADLAAMAKAAERKVEAEVLCRGRPDLVIANHINLMALVAWRLGIRQSIPFRIIAYGTDTQLLLRDQRFRDLFGPAARGADKILCISRKVAREAEKVVGGRIEAMGGAVDERLFNTQGASEQRDGSLVYFGRLVTEKGLWPLLEAFASQDSATELKIIGEGPLHDDLLRHVAAGRLRDRVRLFGFADSNRLASILKQCSVAVVPSLWEEPLGLVVLEAMACGLPVLASNVGGIPELICHGENGLLLPPGDASAWAAAIKQVMDDPGLYAQLVRGVAQTAIRTYAELALQIIEGPIIGVQPSASVQAPGEASIHQ